MTKVSEILENYGLTQDTATNYIEAITRMNQTQTAETLNVSRDTINRYKKAFQKMNPEERLLLITNLTHQKLLEQTTK